MQKINSTYCGKINYFCKNKPTMSDSKKSNEIRIKNVVPAIKQQIENIAAHQGIPVSSFLKPHLRTIVDSYPDKLKQAPNKD